MTTLAEMGLLPHSIDAEQALLGSLLIDPTTITVVRDLVSAEDFYRESHALVFKAVNTLFEESIPADIVTVADLLERVGGLENAGGAAYLHSLPTVVPTAIHCAHYARIVRREAIRRRMVDVGSKIGAIGFDRGRDLNEALDEAQQLTVDLARTNLDRQSGVFRFSDIETEVDDLYDRGWPSGEKTCWESLDRHYSVVKGEWTLLTGIPSHGKSEFLDALMVDFAKRLGWKFIICSPENPIPKHAAKLAEKYIGLPFSSGYHVRMDKRMLSDAKRWITEHFTWVLPHDGQRNLSGVLRTMEIVMAEGQYDGIVIDPWNQLEHDHPREMSETKYVSASISVLMRFAQAHKVHAWLVAHPTKMEKAKDGPYKDLYPPPTAYQVSDSAHWYNKADAILSVWRNVNLNNDIVEVHTQKMRFKQNGVPGMGRLKWDRVTGLFDDIG